MERIPPRVSRTGIPIVGPSSDSAVPAGIDEGGNLVEKFNPSVWAQFRTRGPVKLAEILKGVSRVCLITPEVLGILSGEGSLTEWNPGLSRLVKLAQEPLRVIEDDVTRHSPAAVSHAIRARTGGLPLTPEEALYSASHFMGHRSFKAIIPVELRERTNMGKPVRLLKCVGDDRGSITLGLVREHPAPEFKVDVTVLFRIA